MGYFLEESGIDGAECSKKAAGGKRAAGDIRSLVNLMICSLSVLVLIKSLSHYHMYKQAPAMTHARP